MTTIETDWGRFRFWFERRQRKGSMPTTVAFIAREFVLATPPTEEQTGPKMMWIEVGEGEARYNSRDCRDHNPTCPYDREEGRRIALGRALESLRRKPIGDAKVRHAIMEAYLNRPKGKPVNLRQFSVAQ